MVAKRRARPSATMARRATRWGVGATRRSAGITTATLLPQHETQLRALSVPPSAGAAPDAYGPDSMPPGGGAGKRGAAGAWAGKRPEWRSAFSTERLDG